MSDQPKRAGCCLSALRQCHCIGRAAGPNCRFWSTDLDGDIARSNERTAAERIVPASTIGGVALSADQQPKGGA
jgi:hypothetical protein